jgi:hypothetical protein
MPSSLSSPPLPEAASASFWLAELPLEACYALPLAELRLGPCASMIAGWMHGASDGLPDQSTRASAGIWLTLEAAVAAEWRVVPTVSIRAEVGLARPLLVPEFVMGDGTPLHRTEGWLVRPGIALGMFF